LSHIEIAQADPTQAEAICQVLRRSIQEVCAPDYGNDAAILAEWLENKTPENVGVWIADPNTCSVVALCDDRVVGFGHASPHEVLLNYASPEFLGRGVGYHVLSELERWALNQGSRHMTCTSTVTALSFYERQGYSRAGEPVYYGGKAGDFPLEKGLLAHAVKPQRG